MPSVSQAQAGLMGLSCYGRDKAKNKKRLVNRAVACRWMKESRGQKVRDLPKRIAKRRGGRRR